MSRYRISRVTAVLFAATLISTVPLAFGATAQDIEHLRNGSFAQFQREASQRADEQARQNREQMRQFAEQNRQQMSGSHNRRQTRWPFGRRPDDKPPPSGIPLPANTAAL